jgi:hypothetical protein
MRVPGRGANGRGPYHLEIEIGAAPSGPALPILEARLPAHCRGRQCDTAEMARLLRLFEDMFAAMFFYHVRRAQCGRRDAVMPRLAEVVSLSRRPDRPLGVTAGERRDLVAFLESLTGRE